jgi:diguanylate cyclase (GGDEF)-like protein/putative nucleotidyltransferase with HDIG domain
MGTNETSDIDNLPSLSQVIPEILALKPDDPIDRLVTLIDQDAPLALKVIGVCNAPGLGLRRQVFTVSDAVVGLGLKATRSLALCTAVVEAIGTPEDERARELVRDVHRETIRRAAVAKSLAQLIGASPQEAFTAGLLADIGRFWHVRRHPTTQEAISTLVASGEDVLEVETELSGEDHITLGLKIAQHWQLPSDLVQVVARHHQEEACESQLERIAYLASLASQIQEALITPPALEQRLARLLSDWFGIASEQVPAWLKASTDVAKESARALKIPGPASQRYRIADMCQELGKMYVDSDRLVKQLQDSVRQAEAQSLMLREQVEQLDVAATTDDLTGLANRRSIRRRLDKEMLSATPESPTALLLIDLDRFKHINDTYGHPGGDVALKALAKFLKMVTRGNDLVGRYGGDEFIVILPGSDTEGAKLVAERIRRVIASTPVPLPDGRSIQMNVSVGGCCLPISNQGLPPIASVDRALYAAKRLGRNRVVWVDNGKRRAPSTAPLKRAKRELQEKTLTSMLTS